MQPWITKGSIHYINTISHSNNLNMFMAFFFQVLRLHWHKNWWGLVAVSGNILSAWRVIPHYTSHGTLCCALACESPVYYTLGRWLTTDFRFDWQVVSRSGRMSAIYLLTVFFNLSNHFLIFIIYFLKLLHFNHLLFFILNGLWVSSVAHPGLLLINLFIYLWS
jgi:hypothetical protein